LIPAAINTVKPITLSSRKFSTINGVTAMSDKVGVINPYALGELVAKKNIQWNSVSEPEKLLSEILNIKKEAIFDIRNPILNPSVKIDLDEKVAILGETDAENRLKNFLLDRQPQVKIEQAISSLRLPTPANDKLDEVLLSSAVVRSESSVPWKPADKEWFDKGDYFEDVAEVNDPIQGALGDCYFIAALASVAWARPYTIVNMARPSGWGNEDSPIHKISFYQNGTGSPQSVEVTEKVPVTKTTRYWIYARSLDLTEIWPAVMEKAYAKWRTNNLTDFPNYPAISGGDPALACAQLIGGTRTYKANASTSANDLWKFVRANSVSKRTVNPMVAWTYPSQPSGTDYISARVVANHAYSVLGWDDYNNEQYIVLRNPWGTHHATLDTRSGTWSAHHISYNAVVPLNTNGVFAMKASTFKKYFAKLAVAK
jgi:hypothetical protein